MADELADRMIDLEVKLAYQDRLIRELDAVVRELGLRLDATERELKELKQGVAPPAVGPADEPPPHY
jgi:uncharacterized coiled-coil protein SlyX